MKATSLSVITLKNPKLWLLGLATSLIAIHLTLISRANDASLLGTSALFWIAIWSLLWPKRNVLSLESGITSSLFGISLLALILLKSTFLSGYDPFLRILPFISALSVSLLASGFKGLKQYWQELLILCFIAPSPGALSVMIDISTYTAKFATTILWYLGFDVHRQGDYVILPTAGVQVYPGCSGIESMLQLLGLAVLFLVMFPTTKLEKIIVPIVAGFIAFAVNGVRVSLLATLGAPATQAVFNYWHKGDGSLIFSMISVALFGLFCLFLLQQGDFEDDNSMKF